MAPPQALEDRGSTCSNYVISRRGLGSSVQVQMRGQIGGGTKRENGSVSDWYPVACCRTDKAISDTVCSLIRGVP